MVSTFTYLRSFFKDKDVASVTPTSRFCIREVCEPINFSEDIMIVEYGAGSGVFAEYLLPKMTADSKLVLFETNELLYEKLRQIDDPRVSFSNESVEYVLAELTNDLIGQADYIISGIPFSFFDDETEIEILEQSHKLLKDGGKFLAYQTSGHLEDPLYKTFGNIKTEWEWRNIPPMTVYEAVKNGSA